jgi:hypothetical protein
MLRENGFDAVLTKIGTKSKPDIDKVVIEFCIRHQSDYEKQSFLESYESKCAISNINCLFSYPVHWKNLNLEANYIFDLDFDVLEDIRCILKGIKVKRKIPTKLGQQETFVYDLTFEKEIESGDEDWVFASYLNRKEEDENNKKVLIKYGTLMRPVESGEDYSGIHEESE